MTGLKLEVRHACSGSGSGHSRVASGRVCVLVQVLFGFAIAFVFSVKWEVSYLVEREKGEGFDRVWGDILTRSVVDLGSMVCDCLADENPASLDKLRVRDPSA